MGEQVELPPLPMPLAWLRRPAAWSVEGGELAIAAGAKTDFHASADGARWELVRYFALPTSQVEVGFEVQSPTGPGCTATFGEIAYSSGRLADLRDGR